MMLFASISMNATAYITIENQKMVLHQDEQTTILAPNGESQSYFWASVSPDEKHIVYVTSQLGTFVCDIKGENVFSMGRMNAPKWLDNQTVAGMQEKYDENDNIIDVRYISRPIAGDNTRILSKKQQEVFVAGLEAIQNQHIAEAKIRKAQRMVEKTNEVGLAGIKIYVNPGHGGYDSNDRSCWTIPIPETWINPDGYWESKSNLTKGLALRDLLESAGATVIMSRTTNNSGVRDIEYYPGASAEKLAELNNGDDRDLSAIAEEANANNVDHFISVHSNALNCQTNYLLLLYHGENEKPTVATSDEMAASSGALQIQNALTVWTSPKPLLRGDITFYGDSPTDPVAGLGVLRPLTVPGFLSEGSFHDYAPETHRLMNADYCKLEALRMYQHFHKWFKRELPQTATISGWVKSANEKVDVLNEKKFVYVANSDDQWLPLNGAKVELIDNSGNVIDTYTTDNWYNGIFAFYDLTPGNYKVRATKDKYEVVEMDVTVAAEEIAGLHMRLNNIRLDVEDYPEPEIDAMPLDKYEFEKIGLMSALTHVSKVLYQAGYVYILSDGAINRQPVSAEGFGKNETLPSLTNYEDIAFTADGFLMAKRAGENAFDSWDKNMENPFTMISVTENIGSTFTVSGPRWNAKIFTANGTTMYTIQYDEDHPTNTQVTSASCEDMTGKQLALGIDGNPVATSQYGCSFFKYAKHAYRVDAIANAAFKITDLTTSTPASSVYVLDSVATPEYVTAVSWVEGYDIHVIIAAAGIGMQHYKSLSSPIANIYAGEVNISEKEISFRLNENANSVMLTIEKEGETIDNYDAGEMSKGMHTIANPFEGKDYDAISITPSARPVAYPVKVTDNSRIFQFYAPRGVTVDKTPTSPFFGRIYVAEAVGGQCTEGTAESYRMVSQGIYVLGSDFSDVTNQDTVAWTGNVEWGENNSASNYQFALARPAVAPDGDVFVTSTAFASANVYIMNPANPAETFQPIFSGKRSKSNGQLKTGTKVIANPVMHCFISGTGKDEVLYTYDRDNSLGTVYGNIKQYNLGELDSLPWTTVPTRTEFDDMTTGSHMQNASGQIASDSHGGFWLSQYRYNSSATVPGLIHETNGVLDFNISNNGVDAIQQGGMGISADGSMIALGTELGQVTVWDVEYDSQNVPTLTKKYVIDWGNGAGVTMAVDFDAAGNLYIVSNSNERLMVYALPKVSGNSYTTRIVTKKAADIDDAVENIENDKKDVVRKGVYTITGMYLGEEATTLPQGIYIVDGEKVVVY